MISSLKNTFITVIWLSATLLSLPSAAVVLGNIVVQSSLGQPLRAYIPFTSNRPNETIENKCITLRAPTTATQSASPYLTKARLTVDNLNGKSQILIASTSIIDEPVISLHLHITCANDGEYVREFTVLLDPPEYTQPKTAFTATPVSVTEKSSLTEKLEQPSGIILGERYEVLQQDSLNHIAQSLFPKSRSKQNKFMNATILANPEIFKDPDIKTIPAGTILLLPTKASLRSSGTHQAIPDTQSQAAAPRAKTEKAPTKREVTKQAQSEFKLKLATDSLDLTSEQNLTEQERDQLRERQLMVFSDDQVATMLAFKNQIKVLESRLSEMQLKLNNRITETNQLKQEVDINKASIAKINGQNNMIPTIYWSIGGILTILLSYVAFIWSRDRKRNQTVDFHHADTADEDEVIPGKHTPSLLARRSYVQADAANEHDVVASAKHTIAADEDEPLYNPNSIFKQDDSISLTDFDSVIDEADLYLVYGWSQKAIDLLTDHIQRIKTDVPPWMMLADIYQSNNMFQEFENMAIEFKSYFENTEWWPKIQAIGLKLDPKNSLYQPQPIINNELWEDKFSLSSDEENEAAHQHDLPPDNQDTPEENSLQFEFLPLNQDEPASATDTPEEDDPFSDLAPDDQKFMIKKTFSKPKPDTA